MEHSSYNGKDDYMSTYIKADQFYYPHGVRRGGYLELVNGKFGNMWKAYQKEQMCWIIQVTVLLRAWWIPIFTVLWSRCYG